MEQLWVDKYRPKSFNKLTYHPQITEVLQQLAQTKDFPHMIFYGPQGAGKKTRVYAFLAAVYGSSVYKPHSQTRTYKPQGSSTPIEYNVLSSNYHIEITPSDNQNQDRVIVGHVVKEIAELGRVQGKGEGKGVKLLVINDADKLSKQAQGGLRRTMEKYMSNCRMLLICNSLHRLIPPLRSRCLNLRIPAPSIDQITVALSQIVRLQSSTIFNHSFTQEQIKAVASNCNRNLRVAILQLQASRSVKGSDGGMSLWKREVKQIKQMIMKEQSPTQLRRIRDKFYDLLVNCIEGSTILAELLAGFVESSLSQQTVKEIIHQAAQHQKTLQCGSKAIYHLQSFAAHAMECLMRSK